MIQKPKVETPQTLVQLDVLEKFRRVKLRPSLQLNAGCDYTLIHVQVKWTTLLASDSLKVMIDSTVDITPMLTIDEDAMKATATFDVGGVGMHCVDASGEFLASLVPFRTVHLSSSTGAYCPY